MNVGIALFTYYRADHLKKVLEGLRENSGVELLYIFQDGLRCEADKNGWLNVREIIESIDWCRTRTFYAQENKGLADSILYGINKVLEENDAIIVLEDDCVPQPGFVSFMNQCFIQYENEESVYSVSGYSWPIALTSKRSDIYFCGRACPWGWGTWKKKWQQYQRDYNMIREIKNDKELSRRLSVWGEDLETMLVTNINGRTDSWYVFWALLGIVKNYYSINPYQSLICNIGFDGTGVHCFQSNRFDVKNVDDRSSQSVFDLNKDVHMDTDVEHAFQTLYGIPVPLEKETGKEKVLVYGTGEFYKKHAQEIQERFDVIAFVDTYKKNRYYSGKPLISPKQISEMPYETIIIMLKNREVCEKISMELEHNYGIMRTCILIWSKNEPEMRIKPNHE